MDDDRKPERRDREIMPAQTHGESERNMPAKPAKRRRREAAQNGTPNLVISRVET